MNPGSLIMVVDATQGQCASGRVVGTCWLDPGISRLGARPGEQELGA